VITASTVWILWLISPGGLSGFQGWYWTEQACLAAKETWTHSEYYRAECRAPQKSQS